MVKKEKASGRKKTKQQESIMAKAKVTKKKKVLASVEMLTGKDVNTVFFACSAHSKESFRYSVGQREDGFAIEGSYYLCKFCQFSEVDGDCESGYRRRCNVIGRMFEVVDSKIDIGDRVTIDGIEPLEEYRLFEVTA